MAGFGVDPVVGFKLKRLRDIQLSLQGLLDQIVDPNTGETLDANFDEDDPLIQVLNVTIDAISVAWEVAESAYSAFDPSLASGAALSGLVQINGLSRKSGTPSLIPIDIIGTAGAIIPAGSQITDQANLIVWKTSSQLVIGGGGTVSGIAQSVLNGVFTAQINEVNKILDPVIGWSSVLNPGEATPGTTDELDEILRSRRANGTLSPAQGIVECVYSNILNLDGVIYSRVYHNRSLVTDARGIPGNCIAAVVQGGDGNEIAEQILVRVGTGTETHGPEEVIFTDPFGEETPIRYIRPDEIEIDVEVQVVINASIWGSNSAQDMKDSIIAFAAQGPVGIDIDPATQGFDEFGFPPGEDVFQSKLYTPVNSIPGHVVSSLKMAYSGQALGTADLPIEWNEVAAFSVANINVVVV